MPDATYMDIDLKSLGFDRENPRFPPSLDATSDGEILKFMLEDAGLIDLMRSIAAQGFFPGEPLLVCPHPQLPDKWSVIEGNRRFAASLLLANPQTAPAKRRAVATVVEARQVDAPTELPCLVFQDRSSILKHLGFRHVTGIKEWDPLAKARFLRQRYDMLEGDATSRFRELARTIGSRADYVGRLLAALSIYNRAADAGLFDDPGLSEEDIRFSLITSALAYHSIVEYIGLDSAQDAEARGIDRDRVADLIRWMFERDERDQTRLGESRNLRRLAEILTTEDGARALREGQSLDHAEGIAGGGGDAFRTYVDTALENLLLANSELDRFSPIASDVLALEEVRKLSVSLRRSITHRLDEDA